MMDECIHQKIPSACKDCEIEALKSEVNRQINIATDIRADRTTMYEEICELKVEILEMERRSNNQRTLLRSLLHEGEYREHLRKSCLTIGEQKHDTKW